jgi:hypothetical protein
MELRVGESRGWGQIFLDDLISKIRSFPAWAPASFSIAISLSGSVPPAISVTSTLPISLMVPVAVFPELGRRLKKALLVLETRRPEVGRVLPGGASLPYGSIGVFEKKFAEILEDSEFVRHVCSHGAVGDAFCYATNHLPTRHQYRLQIAEGVLKLLESYQYLDRF